MIGDQLVLIYVGMKDQTKMAVKNLIQDRKDMKQSIFLKNLHGISTTFDIS